MRHGKKTNYENPWRTTDSDYAHLSHVYRREMKYDRSFTNKADFRKFRRACEKGFDYEI